jgi:fluoroacetyl-CoA thioesterase
VIDHALLLLLAGSTPFHLRHAGPPIGAPAPPDPETTSTVGVTDSRRAAYRTAVPITPGLSATITLVVTEADTALAMGSGDVPVLSTPRVIGLAEQATVKAVNGALAEGRTTVGSEVQLTHLAPTLVGAEVRAEVVLEAVEGRKLVFRVTVNDGHGLVAAGYVTRVVVERARFLDRAGSL